MTHCREGTYCMNSMESISITMGLEGERDGSRTGCLSCRTFTEVKVHP